MKRHLGLVLASCLACCQAEPPESTPVAEPPPPLPQGVETVDFEAAINVIQTAEKEAKTTERDDEDVRSKPVYWGLKEGEPLPVTWDDLMPKGAEEELARQYDEFYSMLEKRYMANSTTLSDLGDMTEIAEGSALDFMPQLGTFDTVEDLDGVSIRLPGYIAPFEFDTNHRHTQFLFVPYMGACIHTPPPPPNQIIFVRANPATRIKDIWAPYWIEGTVSTETTENELGDTAYSLKMDSLEPYSVR